MKPKIRKSVNGWAWVCEDVEAFGVGLSPKAAYAVWKCLLFDKKLKGNRNETSKET